jgi:hypothetical protein
MKVIKFAPGLIPVLKHQEHDQSSHGNWAEGSQGSVTELADSDIQDILHNSKSIEEMYQKVADRLGKTLKPKVEVIPEGEENLYRGLANVERDAQQLIDGKIPFTPFQTWGQGIYATPDRQDAEGYGQVVRMKLDDTARIITGEPEPFAVDTSSTPFKSDFIDFPRLLPKILSGEIDNFSISDAYNIYYAAKGYDGYQPHGGEMVLFNGSHLTVNKADIGSAVQKHQEHDQKTHGNWATFTPDELISEWEKPQGRVPASPVNPEGTNAQALRTWVDGPFRNFTGNYPIQDGMRHVMHGVLGLPLTKYMEFHSDRTRYVDPWKLNEQCVNLIQSLDKAPQSQPVLWRGQHNEMQPKGVRSGDSNGYDQLLSLKEGDEFVSPMFSASRDKGIANMYASLYLKADSKPSVVFRIQEGAKGLRTNVIPNDKEVLTGGKFKITGVANTTIKATRSEGSKLIEFDHPVKIISMSQMDTFGREDFVDEDFKPDSAYRVRSEF